MDNRDKLFRTVRCVLFSGSALGFLLLGWCRSRHHVGPPAMILSYLFFYTILIAAPAMWLRPSAKKKFFKILDDWERLGR